MRTPRSASDDRRAPRPTRRDPMGRRFALALTLAFSSCFAAARPGVSRAAEVAQDPASVPILLANPNMSVRQRVQMVGEWIREGSPPMVEALVARFDPDAEPTARQIVLQALYQAPSANLEPYGTALWDLLAESTISLVRRVVWRL